MKIPKTILFQLVLLLFAVSPAAFAQGEFLDVADFPDGSSGSGFLSGDLVSSAQNSDLAGSLGDSLTDAVSSAGGDLAGNLAGSAVSGITGGGVLGDMLGDAASDMVGDMVSDAIGDMLGDSLSGMVGDFLSIPEISSIQETLDGMASSMKSALVTPNIPHYRILWMFSGESVANEVKSIFSGDFSNVKEGLDNLKEMF